MERSGDQGTENLMIVNLLVIKSNVKKTANFGAGGRTKLL